MFFLGGLNSILPYVLYLSLIWLFLLFGFSTRLVKAKNWLSGEIALNSSTYIHAGESIDELVPWPEQENIDKQVKSLVFGTILPPGTHVFCSCIVRHPFGPPDKLSPFGEAPLPGLRAPPSFNFSC